MENLTPPLVPPFRDPREEANGSCTVLSRLVLRWALPVPVFRSKRSSPFWGSRSRNWKDELRRVPLTSESGVIRVICVHPWLRLGFLTGSSRVTSRVAWKNTQCLCGSSRVHGFLPPSGGATSPPLLISLRAAPTRAYPRLSTVIHAKTFKPHRK